jgi:hypothetical protein
MATPQLDATAASARSEHRSLAFEGMKRGGVTPGKTIGCATWFGVRPPRARAGTRRHRRGPRAQQSSSAFVQRIFGAELDRACPPPRHLA